MQHTTYTLLGEMKKIEGEQVNTIADSFARQHPSSSKFGPFDYYSLTPKNVYHYFRYVLLMTLKYG